MLVQFKAEQLPLVPKVKVAAHAVQTVAEVQLLHEAGQAVQFGDDWVAYPGAH